MRISDLSSDVCSSDLRQIILLRAQLLGLRAELVAPQLAEDALQPEPRLLRLRQSRLVLGQGGLRLRQKRLQVRVFLSERGDVHAPFQSQAHVSRSEEHTSELQSLMRISYAVFCLKKKT